MSKNGKEEMIIPEDQNKFDNEEINKEDELNNIKKIDKNGDVYSEKNIDEQNNLLLSFIDIEQDDKK